MYLCHIIITPPGSAAGDDGGGPQEVHRPLRPNEPHTRPAPARRPRLTKPCVPVALAPFAILRSVSCIHRGILPARMPNVQNRACREVPMTFFLAGCVFQVGLPNLFCQIYSTKFILPNLPLPDKIFRGERASTGSFWCRRSHVHQFAAAPEKSMRRMCLPASWATPC